MICGDCGRRVLMGRSAFGQVELDADADADGEWFWTHEPGGLVRAARDGDPPEARLREHECPRRWHPVR